MFAAAFLAALTGPMFLQRAVASEEPARDESAKTTLAPPTELTAEDKGWDEGHAVALQWDLSADGLAKETSIVTHYDIYRCGEKNGKYKKVADAKPKKHDYRRGRISFTVGECQRGEEYYFRVVAVGPDSQSGTIESEAAEAGPAVPVRQWFGGGRFWLLIFTLVLCGAVILWILYARTGKELKVRKIAGLEAMNEAVGRATEMGRSCLFIPGSMDMNDIQTITGLAILSNIAQTAAEYGARIEVPTSRSLVMTAARETVQASYLSAGRPDAYNEDNIYYVTDEQFGYVAYLTGLMVRDKPAACFYMGCFYAEALIIAETGNSIGAIQIAGTAMPAQLPFFVAACDYTLIGEEFFAASAYLSGEPEQMGSLKGQDVGKLVAAGLLILGCFIATMATATGSPVFEQALSFLKDTMLQ